MKSPIHLNHAAVGQLRLSAAKAMRKAIDELVQPAFYNGFYRGMQKTVEQSRSSIASLMGNIDPGTIAFAESTSDAFAKLVSATPFKTGDTVAVGKSCFVSLKIGLQPLQKTGTTIVSIGNDNGEVRANDVVNLPFRQVSLVVIDWVNWLSGFRNNVQEIADHCRQMNIPLIVDAVQGLGATELDFNLESIGALVCGGHKWLGGPDGTGFFYVSKWMLPRLRPLHLGYRSLRPVDEWQPQELRLREDVGVFEIGTLNAIGMVGLGAAIEELRGDEYALHMFLIRQNVTTLYNCLMRIRNIDILTPSEEKHRAGIVSFRSRDVSAKELYYALIKEGLICALRGDWIRFSPAADTKIEEVLQRLAIVLRQTIKPESFFITNK